MSRCPNFNKYIQTSEILFVQTFIFVHKFVSFNSQVQEHTAPFFDLEFEKLKVYGVYLRALFS
jgi:hypothetical protein